MPAAAAPRVSPLADRLSKPMPNDRARSWWVTAGITAVAGVLRFVDLGRPHAVAFDETYYMKDALSYLRYGYEMQFVEGANDKILASDGNWRTIDVFGSGPAYVVHPPVGKWTIAIGEYLFGLNPFGWRFMMALLGTLMVLLVVRITRRLTRSTLIGAIAGFLLAMDGVAIVLSRTALLDNTLAFWLVVAFGCILMDRERTRARLAALVRKFPDDYEALLVLRKGFGPRTGWRPWRWATGFALGMACATKWSGLWFVVAFGIMTVLWDVGMRRLVGVRSLEAIGGAVVDGLVALVSIVGVAFAVYLVSWSGWLFTSGGYYRDWAQTHPGEGLTFLPDALRSLAYYHWQMYNFHVHLSSPHSYQSNAWSWLLQTRPTNFFYQGTPDIPPSACGATKCSAEVTSLGNPLIWWAGTVALLHQIWRWAARRDWRSGFAVLAVLAAWLPWLGYQGRTIFTFYSVAIIPFLCIVLAMSLGAVLGPTNAPEMRRIVGGAVVGTYLLVCVVAASWFFYPIWTAQIITFDQWHLRMWFSTWV